MKKLSFLLVSLGLSMFQITALANEIPRSLATDARMKVVAYNKDDVITLIGQPLVSTSIEFDKDEVILSVVNGDPVAWKTTIDDSIPFILTVNPQLMRSQTDMTVVTNKHVYEFCLMTNPGRESEVTYLLQIKYPDENTKHFAEELQSLKTNFLGSTPGNPLQWNYNYSFYGSREIAPIQVVDNGTFTILKFRNNSPIPAVFAVDSRRNESLLNIRVQNNFVFIQGVRRQYTLRNGNSVTTLYNDSYQNF